MAEALDLIDAGRIHDRSKGTLRKTSLNHFKRYLQSTNSEFQTLDQFPENLIKDELLGKFSTYLKDHVESVKQYTTHKNYLSSLHQAIVELYPAKKVEFENYYRNLLNTVFSQYTSEVASAASVTVSLINHHVPIRTSDREYVNKVLFLESEHIIRCWMNLDFCHAERASEVTLYITQLENVPIYFCYVVVV